MLRQQQVEVRQEDAEVPPLFEVGDLVLLENKRKKQGDNPKLKKKFLGPYEVVQSYSNHTYEIERQGHVSVQNECRLKLYRPCLEESGQAPGWREPNRRPNMKVATRNDPQRNNASQTGTSDQGLLENLYKKSNEQPGRFP